MLSNGNKQHRKKQYSTCPDLINKEESLSLPSPAGEYLRIQALKPYIYYYIDF